MRDPFYNCTAGGGCTSFVGQTRTDFTQDAGGVALSTLNVIPTSRQDPNAVKLLGLYPAPTASGLANDFQGYVPIEDKNTNTYDIRIDANISPKDILFGVYDRSHLTADVPSYFPGVGAGDSGGRVDQLPAWAWAVGYTRILTPTLTNEMHVGMVHSDKLQVSVWGNDFGSAACSGTVNPGPGTCNIPLTYGIQGVPQVAGNGGLPVISIGGLRALGVGNYSPTLQYVWSLEGVDGVTKVWRNHAFKTGIQVDDLEGNISQPPQGRGDMSFNGQYTDISNKSTGLNGIGDLLVTPINYEYGVGNGVNLVGGQNGFSASNIPVTDDHRWYIGAYFQDDWKVVPKLTLNLGLRWDLFTPYEETRGFQSNFLPVGGNGATATFYIPNQSCQTTRGRALQYRGRPQQYQHRVRFKRRTRQRAKEQLRAACRVRLQAPAYAGSARRLWHGLWGAGQPRLRRHAGIELSLRLHPDHPRLPTPITRCSPVLRARRRPWRIPSITSTSTIRRAAKPDSVLDDAGCLPGGQFLRGRPIYR